ncbi:MAG: quinone oxidoreductase, partial [Myxococcales bacterium]|nr:quinone oxidoreductase [Myxococcales bacterium]
MRDHAIRVHEHGGPDVLRWEAVDVGDPGPGEVRVRHTRVGVNFIDTYHRSGLYPVELPSGLGLEAAGVIEAVGAGVSDLDPRLREGQRVVYAMGAPGAYATRRVMAAATLVPLPDDVSDADAAASFLKGLTVQFLVRRCHPVAPGDAVLVHAAAGGVGLLLCQWAKHLGATVIGTAGSEAKAALAREHGADHVIRYESEDFVARTRELTGGEGVAAVYDGVGAATFDGSLRCLRPLGMMVSFGNA